jgi:hypothetical protein
MRARGTINFNEIARPEILDAGGISGTIIAPLSKYIVSLYLSVKSCELRKYYSGMTIPPRGTALTLVSIYPLSLLATIRQISQTPSQEAA